MKKCPFCAEDIQGTAIKCRFCNEFLEGKTANGLPTKRTEWYFKTSTLVVGFFLVGPFIIPLVLFNPYYSKTKKVILFGVCVAATIVLFIGMKAVFVSIEQYYQLLQGNY